MNDLSMNSIAHSRIDDLHRQAAEVRRRRTATRDTAPVQQAPRRGFALFRRFRVVGT